MDIEIRAAAQADGASEPKSMPKKRACAGRTASKDELESSLAKIQAAASGLLEVHVVAPGDAAALMAAATCSDAAAIRLLQALASALRRIEAAPASAPTLCATCPAPLRRGVFFRVILALPNRDDQMQGLGFGICARCAASNAEAHERATQALQRLWPDSRPIEVTHPAGGTA